MVYETIDEKHFEKFGNRNALLQFLQAEQGKFFRAKLLAEQFDFSTTGTQVEIRKCISEFIEQGFPIISTGQGFSWTNSKQQIQYYLSTLEARKLGIERRMMSLRKCMEKMNG